MSVRIGFGFDVHQLAAERALVLGGVTVPFSKGLSGHSDADVLIHAICDALLGAAGLRDIGFHFPNTDDQYKNIDSRELLKRVMKQLVEKKFRIGNIDATLCLEQPKINPHIPAMKKALADTLGIAEDDISIKATTNERMGFIGREEGVTAYAVALIESV
ncbi:MAG TPA: 2-C-methyl-D-erythritol 2,4-cyclodiphosphate synthase [Chitinophagales bacterium]|nr:2-C-methyl-D-erythritol 2,4-cyclodiphosphate synthase [Chitinophagales bacterium]